MDSLADLTLDVFLDRLGSKEPVPGGGAAAGATGAIGAALALMVVSYSIGRKNLAQHQEELQSIEGDLRDLRARMMHLADEDASAYAELSALWGLPKDDPKRIEGWNLALDRAIAVPTGIMDAGAKLLDVCAQLAPICNKNLLSDLAGASALGEACVRAAGQNVRVNALMLDDKDATERLMQDLAARRARAGGAREAIEKACGS
ncbi:MAG: cyclodeaminase/cyclohydrolase family protein [Phycisphaerales bacterium]|nr:cyclodeaminase/cyclohydrolase family protein [Phycisphaerales bacterium]MCB9837412.1 cyclodeaminase/cyclohydrolase family protein [Phycisphaera sp.]